MNLNVTILSLMFMFCSGRASASLCSDPLKILPSETEIVRFYITKGPILNSYLRSVDTPDKEIVVKFHLKTRGYTEQQMLDYADGLDQLIKRHSKNQSEKVVYHGRPMPRDLRMEAGMELHYKGFISASEERELSLKYAKTDSNDFEPVLFEITIGVGELGAQISHLAPPGLQGQNEVLLPRKRTIVYTAVDSSGPFKLVKARLK